MIFLRRQLPLLITMVTGLVMAAQYYVPHPASEQLLTTVTKWLQIIGGFALVLGITSLFHVHAVENQAQGSRAGGTASCSMPACSAPSWWGSGTAEKKASTGP